MPSPRRASPDAESLLAELAGAGLRDAQVLDLARVLRTWPAQTLRDALAHLEYSERMRFARLALTRGEAVPTLRDRLMARYGMSRRSAYRCLADALAMGRRDRPSAPIRSRPELDEALREQRDLLRRR